MRLLLPLLLFGLLSSCAPPAANTSLRIAINSWPGYEFVYLAEQKGFFAEQGVAVTVLQMSGLTDARRAFERGQVDGIGCTIVEMLQSRELSQRSPQVVYVVDYSSGGDVLMATPSLSQVSDLRGKRVAFEPGTLSLYLLSRALEKNQMSIDDVTLMPMAQSSIADALDAQSIDAFVSYPPVSLDIAQTQRARAIFSSRDIPGEVLDIIMFDESVIKQRQDDVRKFVKALVKAFHYADLHPDEAYAVMAKREGISVERFKGAVERDVRLIASNQQADYFGSSGHLVVAISAIQKVLQQNGELKGNYDATTFVPDIRDIHGP